MINFISSWGMNIIIASVIGTVIQMILPEGKNKKYINVVIGVYILVCIISPLINKKM